MALVTSPGRKRMALRASSAISSVSRVSLPPSFSSLITAITQLW